MAVPTETVYGLAVLPQDEPLERLVRAKERAPDKGVTLLVESIEQAALLAEVPGAARSLAERYWPGPLTLVLPVRADVALPTLVTGGTTHVGFRVPDLAFPRSLAAALGPLALTSANVSGQPDSRTADEVLAALGDRVAVVVDGGPSPGGVPSTVVRVEPDDALVVLRPGPIDADHLRAAVEP